MKKFLSTLLVLMLVVAMFTACGGEKEKEMATDAPTEEATDEVAEESTDEAADAEVTEENSNLAESLAVDVSGLKSSDGQPLLLEVESKDVPDRPADPDALSEEEALHWYDMEYAGWGGVVKENLPVSPADGAIGKSVTLIVHGDHPWTTAYSAGGAKKIADAYGMELTILSPNWDLNVQNEQIDQAINTNPDMIVLIPINTEAATQQLKKINEAGVPVIVSNTLPGADALKYALAWTGPDDWGGQFRMLAQHLADELNGEGGVAYITHNPGGSPYFARMMAPRTELNTYAPEMEMLDFKSPGFEAVATKQVVSDWITKYGEELTAIVCADDSAQALGVAEALKVAGREDIMVVAAGNSKIGMDAVKAGDIAAITYQSSEADGAIGMKNAADWFNGLELAEVSYLVKHIITADDVDDFMPAQW